MRARLFTWLGHELVALSGEGAPGLGAAEATRELLDRCDAQLRLHGLSLEHTVRTRLFGADAASRDLGSVARRAVLTGGARSVSSSFVAPGSFDGAAAVALDLLAMRPNGPGAAKTLQEYDPPRAPLRYLTWESLVFLSGVTGGQGTLEAQATAALAEIAESLALAGTSWERVALVTCFLRRGESLAALRRALRAAGPVGAAPFECEWVEGYAPAGAVLEIEVTATR